MRWKQILLCSILTAAGFGGGMLFGMEMGREPETVTMAAPGEAEPKTILPRAVPTASPSAPPPLPTPKVAEKQYLLMLSGSHICIYELLEDGTTAMLQKTEVNIEQLRQEDYENLCRGVTVDSLEEARTLCEDFGN